MTIEKANKVYDILVNMGGAAENYRDSFIYHHTDNIHGECNTLCNEWRFCGKLGYGGKYRSDSNTVDCYLEDETEERLEIIEEINKQLKLIKQ